MCLLALAWRALPEAPLVLAANRDEFHGRPSAPAELWPEAPEVLAGRDLEAGGTWLGVTPAGRLAAVTNYRGPAHRRDQVRSRGRLVADYLIGVESPRAYAERIAAEGDAYNGFNLLVSDGAELVWISNVARRVEAVTPGAHGLSNAFLDTPWPKVERTRTRLERLLELGVATDPEELLSMLADRERAGDAELPDTGIGVAWERLLSSPFIVSPLYGTRCSTAVVVQRDGRTLFVERSFDPAGVMAVTRRFTVG